jgi:hypothetical protein
MSDQLNEFDKIASEPQKGGLIRELWGFVRHTGKWWLVPLLIVLLALAVLVYLSGTGLAPFIYTLF